MGSTVRRTAEIPLAANPAPLVDAVARLSVRAHTVDPGIELVTVVGEVDPSTGPALRRHVLDVIHDGVRYLIVDLTAVTLLSAAGLTVLVATAAGTTPRGHRSLCLVARHRAVLAPLAATGLDTVLNLQSDLGRAYTCAVGATVVPL